MKNDFISRRAQEKSTAEWQNHIIYTFGLRRFLVGSLFPQSVHKIVAIDFSVDSYTISTSTFTSSSSNVHSFISFDKDEIETEEHLSMDLTMILPTIVCCGSVSTTLQTVCAFFLRK